MQLHKPSGESSQVARFTTAYQATGLQGHHNLSKFLEP